MVLIKRGCLITVNYRFKCCIHYTSKPMYQAFGGAWTRPLHFPVDSRDFNRTLNVAELPCSLSQGKTYWQTPLRSKERNICAWLISSKLCGTNRATKKSDCFKVLEETSKSMSLRSTNSGNLRFLESNAPSAKGREIDKDS